MIPSMPGEVTTSSAMLRWEPPTHLPEYQTHNYKLTGLTMNTLFAANVKLITDLGESAYSGVLTVKTLDDKGEVGHFADEVKGQLDDLVQEMKKRSSFCASSSETNVAGVLKYEKLFP